MDDQGQLLMTPDGTPLSLLDAFKINAMDGGMGGVFKTTWRSCRRDILFFVFFFSLHQFNVLCWFIALSSSLLPLRHCTRHAFVCSQASFSVHCYPINVSIFVQLYMECKPVKPLARPRVSRHFSSAGSKRLQ